VPTQALTAWAHFESKPAGACYIAGATYNTINTINTKHYLRVARVRTSEQVRSVQVIYKARTTGAINIMAARVFLCRCVCSVAVESSNKTARQLNLYIARAGAVSGPMRVASPAAASTPGAPAVGGSPPIGGSAAGGTALFHGGNAAGGIAPSGGGGATGGSAPSGSGGLAGDSASPTPRATSTRPADFYDKLAH
jgi:hypothetical protein